MAAYLGFSSTVNDLSFGCYAGVGGDDCGRGWGGEEGEVGLYSGRCVGRELAGAGSLLFCYFELSGMRPFVEDGYMV